MRRITGEQEGEERTLNAYFCSFLIFIKESIFLPVFVERSYLFKEIAYNRSHSLEKPNISQKSKSITFSFMLALGNCYVEGGAPISKRSDSSPRACLFDSSTVHLSCDFGQDD